MRLDLGSPNLMRSVRGWLFVGHGYSPFALAPCREFVVPLVALKPQIWCDQCGEYHEADKFKPIAIRIRSLAKWWNPLTWQEQVIESKELSLPDIDQLMVSSK